MIGVVGAGPAGSYLAYHLARAGEDVHVFEEHDTIGVPIQCTGILTSKIAEMIPEGDYVVNRITKMRIRAPAGHETEVRFAKENIIVCRTKFDRFIAKLAADAGATYHLDHRFVRHAGHRVELQHRGLKKTVEADIIVGADGPGSAVARSAGIYGERQFFMGVQATAELDNDNAIEVDLAHGDFAWIVPEDKHLVRIGLCTRAHAHRTFDAFMRSRLGPHYEKRIVARQAGLIPSYDPGARTHAGNVYLLGDAAGMVKATTAGGILQGMFAAEELAEVILHGGNYERAWRKRIGRDLMLHLLMRKAMDRFRPKDYDLLVRIFQREENRKVLEEFDRDYPSQYLLRLLREPRLALFARVLLQGSKAGKPFTAG